MIELDIVKERINIKEYLKENNISVFDKNREFVGIQNIIEQFRENKNIMNIDEE